MMTIHRLILCASLLLTGCAHTNPEYDRLLSIAEAAPSASAIRGMWFEEHPHGGAELKVSILFQPDGSFQWRQALMMDDKHLEQWSGRWSYAGSGVWKVRRPGPWSGEVEDEYRYAGGKLIASISTSTGTRKSVFSRVAP